MALTHLVDTSVLTRLADPAVRDAVSGLLARRLIARCQLSDLEVGFSARNAAEWDDLMAAITIFPDADVQPTDIRRAGTVQRLLADRGLRGRKVPDLVIAAVAERAELVLLHYDRDFEFIAKVTGQRHEWVAPAGSID